MTQHPDLEDLAVFVLVAQLGSMGQAAQELGLAQPSVSRRMAELERSLDVLLLQRSPRGSTLTTAGRVVVDWASALLAASADFSRSVAALQGEQDESIRVAVSMTIAEHHAPRWVARLADLSPRIRVSLSVTNSTEVAERVEHGDADIGFLESPTMRSSLRWQRIGWDELVVAVPPGHEWTRRKVPLKAEELAATPLLVREPGSGTRETLEHALAALQLSLRSDVEMASNTALRSAAMAGIGPVVLSASALETDLSCGRLVAVAVEDFTLRRPLSAVWRPDAEMNAGLRSLLQVVGRSGE